MFASFSELLIGHPSALNSRRENGSLAGSRHMDTGADETNRTSDLLITNQLLYRLSYISIRKYSSKIVTSFATLRLAAT